MPSPEGPGKELRPQELLPQPGRETKTRKPTGEAISGWDEGPKEISVLQTVETSRAVTESGGKQGRDSGPGGDGKRGITE